ncbi:hypothetical protein ACI2KR_09145 [Pseudomonas luteola]
MNHMEFTNNSGFILGLFQLAVVATLVMSYRYTANFFKVSRLTERMHSIPRSMIGTSPSQYVEIEGQAYTPQNNTMLSPLSGIECVFWGVKVIHPRSNHIKKVIYSRSPFFIKDVTGCALICPGMQVEKLFKPEDWKTYRCDASFKDKHEEFLTKENLHFLREYEFHEVILRKDAPLYITANLISLPGNHNKTIASLLEEGKLSELTALLQKNNIIDSVNDNNSDPLLSVSGKPLEPLRKTWSPKIKGGEKWSKSSRYLYGTLEKPMFVSSVTETMIDSNQPVVLYKMPKIGRSSLIISAIIFVCLTLSAIT